MCADCHVNTHPRWASWSLGVFICIRCSGIHRGMGTHISRVKSADLDAWTDEQTQMMVNWGNRRANKYHSPFRLSFFFASLPFTSLPQLFFSLHPTVSRTLYLPFFLFSFLLRSAFPCGGAVLTLVDTGKPPYLHRTFRVIPKWKTLSVQSTPLNDGSSPK